MIKEQQNIFFNNSPIITTKNANRKGLSNERIRLLHKQGTIKKIEHGIYTSPNAPIDEMYVLQQNKNMLYSHETALYLHDLIDRDPLNYSITVMHGYNSQKLQSKSLHIFYVKKELFMLGKVEIPSLYGNTLYTYSLERTICDILRSQNRLDKNLVMSALKAYVKRKDKDLHTLTKYAKLFRVTKAIQTYLEVLL